MTMPVKELRDALVKAGASPEKADAATAAVIGRGELSSLGMRAGLEAVKADLYRAMIVQTAAIVGLTVALMKALP